MAAVLFKIEGCVGLGTVMKINTLIKGNLFGIKQFKPSLDVIENIVSDFSSLKCK